MRSAERGIEPEPAKDGSNEMFGNSREQKDLQKIRPGKLLRPVIRPSHNVSLVGFSSRRMLRGSWGAVGTGWGLRKFLQTGFDMAVVLAAG